MLQGPYLVKRLELSLKRSAQIKTYIFNLCTGTSANTINGLA